MHSWMSKPGGKAFSNRQPSTVDRQSLNGRGFIFLLVLLLVSSALGRDRQYPPTVPPPKPVLLPAPAERRLANGLRVVVIERHSLPVITLRFVAEAGAEADPPGLAGTAQFVAGLLDEGTTSRTSLQIAEAVDDAGGVIDTGADWDQSYVALSVLADHAGMAFDLVADMAMRAAFDESEVERGRKQLLSSLEILHQDPSYLADAVFDRAIFAGTPYSHPAEGTLDSVPRVTRDDLRRFHERNYRPGNSILAVVGDIVPADAFARADESFGSWKAETAAAPPAGNFGRPPSLARQIIVIDKPDAVQTEIRVGNRAIPRGSPDYDALTMANQILGGPATNRLFHSLRSEHGLTYGASSDLVCHQTVGSWVAKTSTRTPETVEALDLILGEMKRLRDHEPSDAELDATRSYLTGHMALEFETSEDIAAQVLQLMVYNLPLDYWNKFPARIDSISRQEVWDRIREYLNPDRALIVLVGDASGFEKDLKKFGETRIIPLPKLDLGAPGDQR